MTRLLSREEARQIDSKAFSFYGIPSSILMENAGRGSADLFCALLRKENLRGNHVLVLCGRGNNGGDGFVLARHLANRGFQVAIFLACKETDISRDAELFYRICRKMNLVFYFEDLKQIISEFDFLIDAIYGIGLSRSLEEKDQKMIEIINTSSKPVLALDLPSGMNADTGEPLPVCTRARWTATFMLPKKGFSESGATQYLGEICVVDIGIPQELILNLPNA